MLEHTKGFDEHDCSVWLRQGWKKLAQEQVNQARLPRHQHQANLSQTRSINDTGGIQESN